MIEAKIIDLLEYKLNDIEHGHRLYIIKDGEICFYVGQSEDVVNRLWEHLGEGRGKLSKLGRFIIRNIPKSFDFDIVFMRPNEVDLKYEGMNWAVDLSEQELISRLHPCFNIIYNINPSQLPGKYLEPFEPVEIDLKITASDFIPF